MEYLDHELLSHEEEIELAKNGDERLIIQNIRLVSDVAKNFMDRGLDLDDLRQEGVLGLIKAAEDYDPERGYRFSTYATWWIRQRITRAIANKSKTIRFPVHIWEIKNKVVKNASELRYELKREPTPKEISERTGIELEKVEQLIELLVNKNTISLNQPFFEHREGTEILDTIPDGNDELIQITKNILNEDIENALDKLPKRTAEILRLRHGFGDDRCRTLEEVARMFGISRERVRQVQNEGLKKLKKCKGLHEWLK